MTSVPQYPPAPVTEPGAVSRLLAGILGVIAAALVVAGTFLPIAASQVTVAGRLQSSIAITAWDRQVEAAPQIERDLFAISHVPRYGIPLTVTAVVLLVGALLAFTRFRTAARIVLITGGAAVAGAAWTMGMDVSSTLSYEQTSDNVVSHYTTGTGFWVLLGGAVVAVLVLALAAFGGGRWTTVWLPYYPVPDEPVIYSIPDPAPADTWAEPPAQGVLPEDAEAPSPPFPPQDVVPAPGVEPPGKHRDDLDM
ncbi:hypothetical protein VSH64_01505 [Amycolatopsis rhabdoformis]|uniref:Uncharacterized protein n=1 Tax=Amycolatopsis rhabdoformis TaxID=1448059 RepID=A0ABZ1I9T6_9PSEU|nr:hypothetical protein [Amycolatopsis rhabdoformis]WSE30816.1 hypothetical protein VSH64_01505 [Amycolatopsis rhabdoformis]